MSITGSYLIDSKLTKDKSAKVYKYVTSVESVEKPGIIPGPEEDNEQKPLFSTERTSPDEPYPAQDYIINNLIIEIER